MANITILPYQPVRCVVCGRDLPKDRREKCYFCRPKKTKRPLPEPKPDLPYTLEDRAAQALGYGISYGQLMAIIENGGKLPPLKRPIVWPEGSAHAGE